MVVSAGGGVALTSFLGGASLGVSIATGLITAATNIYHALASSPKDKADAARNATNPPIPPKS